MTDPARLISQSRRARGALAARGCSALERHRPATLGPGCVLVSLMLAVAAPAHGFDGEERSPLSADDVVLHGSSAPAAANWVVLDATGIAAWRAEGDNRWQRFTPGEVLPPGCEIETGSDGEVTLVAGGDQLTIAPQGRLIVPIARPGQDRRLHHERGRILVQIEARQARDVRVDTPLLSLGIKGTTFEVLVEPTQDSVLVHEGDVEVTTPGSSDAVDLGTGEGLRQPAVPGSEGSRFTMPVPEGPPGAADGPAWRLSPAAVDDPGRPQTQRNATDGLGQPQTQHNPTGGPDQAETGRTPATTDPGQTRNRVERERRGGSARTNPATSEDGLDFGPLDELALSWGSLAIAAIGLLILTIPALALLQHLREQWLGRPKPTGERRRRLVRG
jgi:FecR protein